jgi:hypothetical protein
MGTPDRLHVELDIDLAADPIAGVVSREGAPVSFVGWMQLTAALDGLLRAARVEPRSDPGGKRRPV